MKAEPGDNIRLCFDLMNNAMKREEESRVNAITFIFETVLRDR